MADATAPFRALPRRWACRAAALVAAVLTTLAAAPRAALPAAAPADAPGGAAPGAPPAEPVRPPPPGGGGPGPPSGAGPAGAVERLVSGLASSDAQRRLEALGGLLPAARAEPGLAPRVLPALREILRLREAPERVPAARALLALRGPEALDLWLRLLHDPEQDERVLEALTQGAVERAGDALLARLLVERSGDPRASEAARGLALEALGGVGGPGAWLRLSLARTGAGWVEESCRALGLMRLGGLNAVPPLLDLLGHDDVAPRTHAWEALTRLTGQRLPPLREPWAAWWRARATAPQVASGPGAPPAPEDRYAPPPDLNVPRFYGVPLAKRGAGHHVAFCLDVSQSMYGPPLDRSRRELEATLKQLATADRFEVVAFNENALPWAHRLVRAHPVAKARAIQWFATLEPTSYTNLYDALEIAFGLCGRGRRAVAAPERLDAIYLLSDGEPNRGRYLQPGPIVKALAELSRPDVPIHTVGAGEAAFSLLRQIAAATGGTFTDAYQ